MVVSVAATRFGRKPARAMPPRLTPGSASFSHTAQGAPEPIPSRTVIWSIPLWSRRVRTITILETTDGWSVLDGDDVLLVESREARSFQAALDHSSRLFEAGEPSQVVLSRLDS